MEGRGRPAWEAVVGRWTVVEGRREGGWRAVDGHRRFEKVMEGHRRFEPVWRVATSWKVMEGHGRSWTGTEGSSRFWRVATSEPLSASTTTRASVEAVALVPAGGV